MQTAPDAAKVDQYLKASGYTKTNGFYTKNGQKITVKYNVPSDWGDWVAVANIMKQNLQSVGIDGQVNAISDDNYFTARSTGSFDAMIGGMFGGPTPYYLYNTHLNSKNDASTGGWNWGHYKNPDFDTLLQQYASTSDATQQQIDHRESQRHFQFQQGHATQGLNVKYAGINLLRHFPQIIGIRDRFGRSQPDLHL